jgi:hypothetical protein
MSVNPLTYGLAALRRTLYLGDPSAVAGLPPLAWSLGVITVFGIVMFAAATQVAERSTTA